MSRKFDRREFLRTSLGAGATLLAGSTISCVDDSVAPYMRSLSQVATTGDLYEPPLLKSVAGVLTATLTIGTKPVIVAGRKVFEAVTYNDSFPGPTLVVRPGDTIVVRLVNHIAHDEGGMMHMGYGRSPRPNRMTNLHFHGLHVPPTGSADNMTVMVPGGGTHQYSFQIPTDHPAGLFWYHAHVHGLVTSQVSRGAAGMLLIENGYSDNLAQLGIRRRLLMLQQAYFDEDERELISDDGERDDPDLALSLINGAFMPEISMRPGEPQVWSLVNASSSAFYKLRLDGHTFDLLAIDGIPLRTSVSGQNPILIPPGTRVELLVRGNSTSGTYPLSYDAYNQGVDTWPAKQIGTVVVSGTAWSGPDFPGVDHSAVLTDLSALTVAAQRNIVFGTDLSVAEGEFGRFTINGHAFDPAYSEWTSQVGTVEEWLISNETDQEHPFHVHINPFQVTKVNGAAVPFNGYQDVVIIPVGGSVTVRTRLADFTGKPIVMHCHILDHEDMGMMTTFTIAGVTA